MLIRKKDLGNISDEKVYEIDIKTIIQENDPYLKRLEDNKGHIAFYYDILDKLRIEYDIEGKMVCPDSYDFKDVYLDYHFNEDEEVTFDENEEGFFIYGDIELEQLVLNIVLPEVPIKVENENKIEYYSGDGWSYMSEEEYDKGQKNKIDPRLAKLLDYKEEK